MHPVVHLLNFDTVDALFINVQFCQFAVDILELLKHCSSNTLDSRFTTKKWEMLKNCPDTEFQHSEILKFRKSSYYDSFFKLFIDRKLCY